MNNKAVTFLKNFSYTLSSNLISLIISTIVILIVPKLLGVEDYGYWQLYLFYSSYVGFLHFGWNDGIYLRYGGKEYNDLNKNLFFSQFWMLVIFQIIISVFVICLSITFSTDTNRSFILIMTALCLLIVNVRFMLIYILQGTNRIKEYAQITMMERVLYCLLILLFLLVGVREYKILIVADLAGKFISLFYSIYSCKDIVFKKVTTFYFDLKETYENIRVGIKLMFSNIASMLIIGIVQFGIERTWDVATFGKVSLTLVISNLMMVFISAVGVIMFPVLRRTNQEMLPNIYKTMRTTLMAPLLGLLMVYFPLKVILSVWLPQYEVSLMYMALLFPMCVFEGKMSLLINTYLKTLRKEKWMLTINIVSVLFSLVLTAFFTIVFKNLSFAIVSIVILLAFRCAIAEVYLSKILNISVQKDIILELVMTLVFILTGWFLSPGIGIVSYLFGYLLYLLIKRKDINTTFINVKQLARG
ncbi:polysaccharide transporter [Neobacillus bataviensis LMG 21833]|uniref:Polysaccharide transporter n=1 Tax=Neobacillus bataviensis LMG 21833 TaxID=1117379 RepID=K6DSJ8_9BACI|nr:oligosaccharide flippase family protein [Neobacillus bataviensis]EKN71334.1 polysaccharide transporter [Neobacillus bataviensis LMG 21833]